MIKINSLTDPETLEYAEQLLANPVFNAVFYEARNDAIMRWAATSPEQIAVRESAWSEYRAVDALMQSFKNLKAEIKAVIEQQREADEDGRQTKPG